MDYIYVLKLTNDKIFIHKSNEKGLTVEKLNESRYLNQWIVHRKIAEIIEVINIAEGFNIQKLTVKYVREYGIENVRAYNMLMIHDFDFYKTHILNDLAIDNKCFNCGKIGHFYHRCPILLLEQQKIICTRCKMEGHLYKECKEVICHKCKIPGHNSKHNEFNKCRQQGDIYYTTINSKW